MRPTQASLPPHCAGAGAGGKRAGSTPGWATVASVIPGARRRWNSLMKTQRTPRRGSKPTGRPATLRTAGTRRHSVSQASVRGP